MTEREDILQAIDDLVNAGRSPEVEAIAAHLGVDHGELAVQLDALDRSGAITRGDATETGTSTDSVAWYRVNP